MSKLNDLDRDKWLFRLYTDNEVHTKIKIHSCGFYDLQPDYEIRWHPPNINNVILFKLNLTSHNLKTTLR